MTDSMLYVMACVEGWKASLWEAMEDGERGQGMVEYGLILALVAIAAIVVLGLIGGQLNTQFEAIRRALGGR